MPQSATLLPTSIRVIAWPSTSSVASPFGSSLPNRAWSDVSRGYRYGFNGKEKDSETANDNYDFGARILNSNLSRFFSLDPRIHEYAWQSPYAYYSNSPISIIDFNGEGEGDRRTTTISQKFVFDKTEKGAKLAVGTDFITETVNQVTYSKLDDGTVVESITTVVTTVMINSKGEIDRTNVKFDYYSKVNHYKKGKYVKSINYDYHTTTSYDYLNTYLKKQVQTVANEKKNTGISSIQKKADTQSKIATGIVGGVASVATAGISKKAAAAIAVVTGATGALDIKINPEIYRVVLSSKTEKL